MIFSAFFVMLAASSVRPPWAVDLQRYDDELATVSYRIARAAGDSCPEKAPLLGFTLHDLSQYGAGDRASVAAAYGFSGYPLILAVAAGSSAAASGMSAGDSLIAVNGIRVPSGGAGANSYDRVSAVWAMLDDAARRGDVKLTLQRGNERHLAVLRPLPGCRSRVELGSSRDIDAVADDNEVVVNIGALEFAEGEDEAAAIVGHELAHNILHHREMIAAASRPQRQAVAERAETEADRLSITLLERAGYDPEAILRFWQRFLTRFPGNRRNAALERRVALIRTEIASNDHAGRAAAASDSVSHSPPQ